MNNAERKVSMGFTAEQFPAGTHMCYIYNDDKERKELIARFLESGLNEKEKVGYFVDTLSPDEMRAQLRELGVRLPPEMDERDFSITSAQEVYCPNGIFVPENMLQTLRLAYKRSRDEGFPGIRVSGEMSWALRGMPGSERLMEYEAGVNTVLQEYPVTAICQYDARRFDGAMIFDVLNVHPMMIIRGQVVRNPYYIEPEKFFAQHRFCC